MSTIKIVLCLFLTLNVIYSVAQEVLGETSPTVGTTYTYTCQTTFTLLGPTWIITGGTKLSQGNTGMNYWATVQFSTPGPGSVQFKNSSGSFSTTLPVTIVPSLPTPATPTISSYNCGSTIIARGTPPANVTWYWQTIDNGTSTADSNPTYTVTTPGVTIYLRAKAASSNNWSSLSSSIFVNVTLSPAGGTIASPENAFWNSAGGQLVLQGNSGTIEKWQRRPLLGTWTDIPSTAGSTTYNFSVVDETTEFRTLSGNGPCTGIPSSVATVSVIQQGFEGSISGATKLIGTTNNGNLQLNNYSGTINEWQYSDDGLNWIPIASTTNATLNLTDLATDRYYRVKITKKNTTSFTTGYLVKWYPAITQDMISTSYLQEEVIRVPEQNISNLATLTPAQKNTSYTYSDGLGRQVQRVSKSTSPLQKDMISFTAYDALGREQRSYLPYTSTGTNYYPNYLTEQTSFYNGTSKVETDANPFAAFVFDGSPFNKVIEQGAPGTNWQPGTGHTIRSLSRSNTANEIRIWKTNGTSPGFYAANTLSVEEVTDENNNKVISFMDKRGLLLQKHVQSGASSWLKTINIYDVSGRLKYTLQPEGVKQLAAGTTISASLLTQFAFQYTYDTRGRVSEKKVPGAASVFIAYDPLQRPVLVQDGFLRTLNKWAFVKYDLQNRPVMQGLYTNTTQTTQAAIQTLLDGLYAAGNVSYPATAYYEDRGATLHGYANMSFPKINADNTTPIEVLNVSFYDIYDLDDADAIDDFSYVNQNLSGESAQTQGPSLGLPTGSKRLILGTTTWLYNYLFYDRYGRVIQTRGNNQLNPAAMDNLTTTVYDFEGKPLVTKTYHNAGGSKELAVIQRVQYDQAGRTKAIFSSTSQPNGQTTLQPLQWDAANVTVNGTTLTKTGGANNVWGDAGAFSLQSIPANSNGWVEFTAGEVNTYKMMGLSSTNGNVNYNTINYALYPSADAKLYVYENGILRTPTSTWPYTITDVLRVERIGSTVVYKKNGVIFYTSTTSTNSVLYADCSFYTLNSSIKNVSISISAWRNMVGITNNGAVLTKTGGTNAVWDAGAFSLQSIPANTNGWIEFATGEANTYKMMGLSSSDGNANYTTINYALQPAADGKLYIYENGTAAVGYVAVPYAITDIFKVERVGTAILYKQNGILRFTSTVPSSSILYGDCSFYSTNATLKNVLIGVGEVQVANYNYNELGQLVEKQLHVTGSTALQSVDYRYNIRGWMKSINNAQLTSDGVINDDANDYFGMEFLYNTAEAGLSNTTYFNGNISAIKWKGIGTATGVTDQRSYKYTYDNSDRLLTATSQGNAAGAWTKEVGVYNESMTYDDNGNIKTLQRNQRKHLLTGVVASYVSEAVDNLTYTYAAGNMLSKVDDAIAFVTGQTGFNNGANITTEYTYDSDGSLITDQNKTISNITYNVLGKPTVILFTDSRKIEYTYDATGNKLTTKNYIANNASPQVITEYVGGFVYENTNLSFFGSPEGRVVKTTSGLEYQYSIPDHQGNTRVVFSAITPDVVNPKATFEGDANDGAGTFQNINPSNIVSFVGAATSGTKVLRVNQTAKIAASKSTRVFPGDKVDIEVWEYHEGNSGFGTTSTPAATLINMVAGAFGGVSGGAGESGLIYNGVNSAVTAFMPAGNQGSTRPAGYLNYILFDNNFKVLDMGWQLAPATTFTKQKLSFSTLNIKEPGYVYVYLSYDNDSNNWIYFDDLKVTHTKTNVIQYNEYYPFGLQTNYSWTRENNKNNFLYDGAMELNPTSGWYDLAFRNYDPVLGRFHQVDPLADKYENFTPYNYSFNDPVFYNDPYGDDAGDDEWEQPGVRLLRYLDAIGAHYNFSGVNGYDGTGSYYGGIVSGQSSWSSGNYIGEDAYTFYGGQYQDALIQAANAGNVQALTLYAQMYGQSVDMIIVDWYTNGIQDADHYIDTEYRFELAQQGDPSNSFHFIHDEREAYIWMRGMQDLKDGKGNILGREVVGVLSINQNTGKKGVLILPWSGNTYTSSNLKVGFYGSFYEDQNGVRYTPLAIVHTHPENDIGPSTWGDAREGDLSVASRMGLQVPYYILGSLNYVQIYPSSSSPGSTYDLTRPNNPGSLFPK